MTALPEPPARLSPDELEGHRSSLFRFAMLQLRNSALAEDVGALFDQRGAYVERPADWGSPDSALLQKKFFEVLERCMEGLPGNTARVFAMREIMGLDTEEICKEAGISATNCGVLLYRARMALRLCLDQRWFGGAR